MEEKPVWLDGFCVLFLDSCTLQWNRENISILTGIDAFQLGVWVSQAGNGFSSQLERPQVLVAAPAAKSSQVSLKSRLPSEQVTHRTQSYPRKKIKNQNFKKVIKVKLLLSIKIHQVFLLINSYSLKKKLLFSAILTEICILHWFWSHGFAANWKFEWEFLIFWEIRGKILNEASIFNF